MDTIHKTEYKIRDLGTRSVTLFPTRAQVVREIKDLPLKPGANEITIVGLTPTIDEHSIKVEGTGSAIISDIAVELLPNREIFQDIFPDSDDDKSDNESDPEDDHVDEKDSQALEDVRDRLFKLRDDQKRAKEVIASAESRLKILDAYGKQLDRKRGVNIEESIDTYKKEREKVFDDHMAGMLRDRELSKEITEAVKEETDLLKLKQKERQKAAKDKAKIQKVKDREKEKKARREAERQKEKERIRKEREHFWPRFCYSVRITLDAANFTPASSRRASIASDIAVLPSKIPEEFDDASQPTCDLSLTYVTTSAFWAPSYDLQLSTTSNTAMLCFDAQLTNATCETWKNCKVTLSTSQTTFSGLEDTIPTLTTWRIKLASKGSGIIEHDVLHSREERYQKDDWQGKQRIQHYQKPRANLFGVSKIANSNNMDMQMLMKPVPQSNAPMPAQAPQMQVQQNWHAQGFGNAYASNSNALPPPPASTGALFGGAPGSSAFGATAAFASKKSRKSGAVGGSLFGRGGGFGGGGADADEAEEDAGAMREGAAYGDGDAFADDGTILEPQPELDFQESEIEETGFTTTYDLPGLKTLAPKSTASKQRVARLNFSNVVFSHTVIAKYKPVAYLRAKLRNNSKLTLLKGAAGLTLDGSFMGRTSLPRCSAGETFTLSLGVDPAIKVIYPKPDVRRATTGLFSKEDSSVYTRTVTIVNSRASAGKPVSLLVLDQAPVSEDERLKVEILAPRGMSVGGSGVSTGVPGREGKDDKEWGKATSTLKKGGEITWDVSLNAGKAVKLGLEYVVALPSGDHAVQC